MKIRAVFVEDDDAVALKLAVALITVPVPVVLSAATMSTVVHCGNQFRQVLSYLL